MHTLNDLYFEVFMPVIYNKSINWSIPSRSYTYTSQVIQKQVYYY